MAGLRYCALNSLTEGLKVKDNDIIALLISIISSGLTDLNILGVQIQQAYQPTQQGIIQTPVTLISKIDETRLGWSGKNDVWDENTQSMTHTEIQYYDSKFQVETLVPQVVSVTDMTASDLINSIIAILQSDKTLKIMQQSNVQSYRIIDIRNPFFMDDRNLFEMSPSFDISILHEQFYSYSENPVNLINEGIYPI
jgi:hypothetical protein